MICRAPLGLGEPLPDRQREAWQHRTAAQLLSLVQKHRPLGSCVDADRPRRRIDVPDQANPGLEVLVKLPLHFLGGVSLAQDFHHQVGGDCGNVTTSPFPLGITLPRDEGDIGNSHLAREETHHAVGADNLAQVMSLEVFDVMTPAVRTNGFIKPHDFLHEHAVNQLAEPVFSIVHGDDIVLGGRAGNRLEASAPAGTSPR